jgi:predicted RNA methylase
MKIWSDTEYVYRCLADQQRTLAFKQAIEAVVKPGDVVLDVGTGSGIMAILAARNGARTVYAVEVGKYLHQTSKQIFASSPYSEQIVPLQIEARDLNLQLVEKPAVVICEQITTGLIGEPQGPVINALKHSGVVDEQTAIIPAKFSTNVQLINFDFSFYGVELKFPVFIDYFTREFGQSYQVLSEEKLVHSVSFAAPFDEQVTIKTSLHASTTGVVNGLLLTSTTELAEGIHLGTCVSYAQPVILPLPELLVSEQSIVDLMLQYEMGQGFDTLQYSADVGVSLGNHS